MQPRVGPSMTDLWEEILHKRYEAAPRAVSLDVCGFGHGCAVWDNLLHRVRVRYGVAFIPDLSARRLDVS